jgi:hypothetical protein
MFVKLQDFGLWFQTYYTWAWSVTIPKTEFRICYDGRILGWQYQDSDLKILEDQPHIIKLKNKFAYDLKKYYRVGRLLTLDDFEIIENPDYKERP